MFQFLILFLFVTERHEPGNTHCWANLMYDFFFLVSYVGNIKCHFIYSNVGSSVLAPAEPVNFELHQKQSKAYVLASALFQGWKIRQKLDSVTDEKAKGQKRALYDTLVPVGFSSTWKSPRISVVSPGL